jgi:predicted nucleic acid-binding protein
MKSISAKSTTSYAENEEKKKLAIVWRRYSLSFADCFAVSTARREKARILTGDPEFKKVIDLAEIEWIIP